MRGAARSDVSRGRRAARGVHGRSRSRRRRRRATCSSSAAASTSTGCASCWRRRSRAEPPAGRASAGRAHAVLVRGARRLHRLRGRHAEPGLLRPRVAGAPRTRRGAGAAARAWADAAPARAARLARRPDRRREHGARARRAPRARRASGARDLLDGILGALVKDELELGVPHPMLDAAHAVLRGGARGKLADGRLAAAVRPRPRSGAGALRPRAGAARPRTVDLELEARARALAAAAPDRVLGLPGFEALDVARCGGRRASAGGCVEHRGFDGAAIEAAGYGPTVAAAAAARLLERLARVERDAGAAAAVLADAALCGVVEVAGPLLARVRELVGAATDVGVGGRGAALGRCTCTATSACSAPRATRRTGSCSRPCYDRVLWLLGGRAPEDAGVEAVARGGRDVRALRRRDRARARRRAGTAARRRRTPRPGCAARRSARCGCSTPPSDDELVAGPVQFADPGAARRLPVRAVHARRASPSSGGRTWSRGSTRS